MGSTALIVSVTVTTLVAENMTGDVTWSGVPVAAAVLGTAVGTSLLAIAMTRWGRRASLATCYVAASMGAFLACTAAVMVSLPLLITGALIVGLGNSANALTRYVAADLQRPARPSRRSAPYPWVGPLYSRVQRFPGINRGNGRRLHSAPFYAARPIPEPFRPDPLYEQQSGLPEQTHAVQPSGWRLYGSGSEYPTGTRGGIAEFSHHR